VAYGPRHALVPAEVLKKRKAYASGKVLSKRPKAPEKNGTEPAKVFGARMKGGIKWSSDADILSRKSVKLSKGIILRTIASAATTRITPEARRSVNLFGASGSKAGGRVSGCKTVPRAKMAAPSAKKRIIPAIGVLATISSEGTQESSLHDQAPEV
jgi:hypothetical protein